MASDGISYTVVMDATAAKKMMVSGASRLPSVMNRLLLDSGYYIRNEMSERAPSGVGGANGRGLRKSIAVNLDTRKHEVEIVPTVPYADAVETGSRPHRPPTHPHSALAQWCEMKGLNLWAIAASIARKGTRPHPYIEPTYRATAPRVTEMLGTGIAQYIQELENGNL